MEKKKGTVTPLASIFSEEEALKASQRVQQTIAERQKYLQQLNGFIGDNKKLINLVHKLPDELQHELMVPFGKAAFFPGRLIHTNECMVLLGEGYYVQRTTKQTTEILKRRGKELHTQVDSLKAAIDDLKAEARFFDATASEASENLVEIREDYDEEADLGRPANTGSESSNSIGIKVDNEKPSAHDEGNAHVYSIMDELEKEEEEELEVGNSNEKPSADDEEFARIKSIMDKLEKEEEEEEEHLKAGNFTDEDELEEETEESSVADEDEQIQNELISSIGQMSASQEISRAQAEALEAQLTAKDVSPHDNPPIAKSSTGNEIVELPQATKEDQSPVMDSNPAFTGTIIERNTNIGTNAKPVSSRPVSRFKMQMKQS